MNKKRLRNAMQILFCDILQNRQSIAEYQNLHKNHEKSNNNYGCQPNIHIHTPNAHIDCINLRVKQGAISVIHKMKTL